MMEQFNLEKYLKNPSRKVVTRDGQAVKIYCTNYVDGPIIAKIEGDVFSRSFREDGRYTSYEETDYDLFFASEKHEGWVNIYPNSILGLELHKSEEDAKDVASPDVIATVKIEWEE